MIYSNNGLKFSPRKIKKFSKFFFDTMQQHIQKVVDNEPDDYALLVKKLDAVVYAYTGDEDLFLFDKPFEKQQKIESCEAISQKIGAMDRSELLFYISKIVGVGDKAKDVKVFIKDHEDIDRTTLIANLLCSMTVDIVADKNPTILSLKDKKTQKDNSGNPFEDDSELN